MAKLGISLKIDLMKIEKARIFAAKSGAKYIDLTTFIDTEQESQFGDHGFISHSQTKDEREQKVNTPICGNAKVFWSDLDQAPQQQYQPVAKQNQPEDDFGDTEIPF
ncbi:hypothetical protein NVP1162O_38 [Vibrio phage 1.162.O._10N.261.48.E3]|nr:hypothetical protein NVP1147O_38 [Vibrio phage 1.147.O._10N.286.49.E9]AUR91708.1 hypothetical protein NVP1162O_38 [Vibrio phage 1.162.O._10N.261.48.E3]AUR93070.1 hypothetical protein NVP1182O_28 [Vibrio phage 1.182.O._10N.286.46.E1]AUR96564.1 hypothetical protein NVP1226O_37 [Vibrio phage 1.226.O._10N.261.48.E5]AUR99483.1 hypothetical protein NVP1266O_34 [Vibrio phage 1.266.O._10N.286.52.F9]